MGHVQLNDPATGTYAQSNVGSHINVTVTGLALSGSASANYTLASTTVSALIGTINPADITVTALGGSSTYGQSPANPGLSATGLQNGETVTVLTGLSNSFGITATTAVTTGSPYVLLVSGTLTNPNYHVTATINGSWIVNATANFSGVDFQGANLQGTSFVGVNLTGADFQGANLQGANLTGAVVMGANLAGRESAERQFHGRQPQ